MGLRGHGPLPQGITVFLWERSSVAIGRRGGSGGLCWAFAATDRSHRRSRSFCGSGHRPREGGAVGQVGCVGPSRPRTAPRGDHGLLWERSSAAKGRRGGSGGLCWAFAATDRSHRGSRLHFTGGEHAPPRCALDLRAASASRHAVPFLRLPVHQCGQVPPSNGAFDSINLVLEVFDS